MSMPAPEVLLLVPGWRQSDATELCGDTLSNIRLVARPGVAIAGRELPDGLHTAEEAVLAVLGMPVSGPGELPAAALMCAEPGAICMDPVHHLADRDHARLLSAAQLDIQPQEARALADAVDALVREEGCGVIVESATRWFFHGMSAPHPHTWPAHAIVQRNTAPYMPKGVAGAPWRTLLTEIQMLFHAHPVNQARLSDGRQTINGAWFWGGAALPSAPPARTGFRQWHVCTNDPFALAAARWCGQTVVNPDSPDRPVMPALPSLIDSAAEAGCNLLRLDTRCYDAWLAADVEAMSAATRQIAEELSGHWCEALASGRVSRVIVHTCEGVAHSLEPATRSMAVFPFTAGKAAARHWLQRVASSFRKMHE